MHRFHFVLLLGLAFTGVRAEDCSRLLSQGIYDIHSSASDLNTASSFSQWFCDNKFSSSEQANSFGASLDFPFKGVPVKLGLDSSSQSWDESYSRFCANVKHDQSLQSKVREHVQTINPQIIDAFDRCLQSDGLHVWLERTYDPRTFRFVGRFNPTDPERSPTTKITTFDIGKNISCSERPQKISKTEWRTRCTRKDDRPVTIVVNATPAPIRGGGTLDLPEIAKYVPSPPPPPWALIRADCANVQYPDWQVMISNASAPTQIVLTGWWFNHVPTSLIKGDGIPIEVRDVHGGVVRKFANDGVPFLIQSGQSAYFKIGDIPGQYGDNDIPWAGNARQGQPPLRFLVKQRTSTPIALQPQSPLCVLEP